MRAVGSAPSVPSFRKQLPFGSRIRGDCRAHTDASILSPVGQRPSAFRSRGSSRAKQLGDWESSTSRLSQIDFTGLASKAEFASRDFPQRPTAQAGRKRKQQPHEKGPSLSCALPPESHRRAKHRATSVSGHQGNLTPEGRGTVFPNRPNFCMKTGDERWADAVIAGFRKYGGGVPTMAGETQPARARDKEFTPKACGNAICTCPLGTHQHVGRKEGGPTTRDLAR